MVVPVEDSWSEIKPRPLCREEEGDKTEEEGSKQGLHKSGEDT